MERQLRCVVRIAACFLTIAMHSVLSPLRADVSPDPANGGLPFVRFSDGTKRETRVSMQHEIVKLKVTAERCDVHVVFTMRNTGDAAEEMPVGFPMGYKGELEDFAASINGVLAIARDKTVTHRTVFKRDGEDFVRERDSHWKLWSMSFPPMKDVKIEVSYSTPLRDIYGYSVNFGGISLNSIVQRQLDTDEAKAIESLKERLAVRQVKYVLVTGSGWHGPIGHCRVEVDFEGITTANLVPQWNRDPTALTVESPQRATWEKKDFEPKHDINFYISPDITRTEIDQLVNDRLKVNSGDVDATIFAAGFRRALNREAEAQRLLLDLYRDWQDRVAMFANSRDDVSLRSSMKVWLSLHEHVVEENSRSNPALFTEKQIVEEFCPIALRMAKRVEAQSDKADPKSKSAQWLKHDSQQVIQWCQKQLQAPKPMK